MVTREVIDSVTQCLTGAGISCTAAWPNGRLKRYETPKAALSLSALKLTESGFNEYMGRGESGGTETEYYGRRADAEVALDLFSPAENDMGTQALETTFDTALNALLRMSGALKLGEMRRGEAKFDTASGMFRLRVTLCFELMMTASVDVEAGQILEFRLGEITINV